jgi:GAF domain-containing protein
MMVVSLNYLMARMISSLDQSRKLLGELEFERKDLEIRVSERTRALETSTEVSRRLSTILDQQELVNAIVEEVQGAFGYYHVHIYLYDASEEHLLMVGGTGEAGRVMLGRGHSIPKGLGLAGRAAEQNKLVLVPDTSMDADWLPNPLLPETMAEIAVPIASGERVLGVLDVQHDVVNGLGQDDATLLSSIANQVAVAVQNAQLYAQAQWKADRETLLNQINQHIQAAGTVEDVLIIAARELSQALEAERALIQLGGISSNGGAARYLEGIVS